jgi:enamine deaminase RidA (YjgF/YER057c/UK114 family)
MSPYQKLQARGLALPPAPKPIANFQTHVREGNLIFLSGQGPIDAGGRARTGKVGVDVSTEEAYVHAQLVGINLLAVMHEALGDLARVKRVIKLLGMVNASPSFCDHPLVINGCSDLFVDVFGETDGSHARSAVGVGSLPGNITVEIEAVIAVRN